MNQRPTKKASAQHLERVRHLRKLSHNDTYTQEVLAERSPASSVELHLRFCSSLEHGNFITWDSKSLAAILSQALKHSQQNYCQLAFGSLPVCSDTGVQPVKKEAHLSHSGAQKHQKAALTSTGEIYSLCSCCIARKMGSSPRWQLKHGYFKIYMLVCSYSKPRQPLWLLECGSSELFYCI